ncbi:hypothetical protein SCHPADRAFT_997074 [Schizopora paradoxa]|uniref:MYND-type domain-containing protein n=1 Tax=Schizopora paradoxa TaxID=27342 RepID=A0A0H2RP47_9AGAM|nr:hypothetical protein SCHPADRAFT_997074 [Schizopora paradoxa]
MGTNRNAQTSMPTRNPAGRGDGIITEKVIAAARKGSIVDLALISTTFEKSREAVSVPAVEALLCQLKADAIPKLENTRLSSNSNRFFDPKFKRQMAAITGIAALTLHLGGTGVRGLPPLLKSSWPNVFPWMQFFFGCPSDEKSYEIRGHEVPASLVLLGTFSTFLAIQDVVGSKLVQQTPGAARLATQLWIREALDPMRWFVRPNNYVKDVSLVLIYVLGDKPSIKVLDEVVEGADAEGDGLSQRLPKLVQKYLEYALNTEGELNNITEILDILVILTNTPHSHPLKEAFFSHGMVPFMVKYLASLGAKLPSSRSPGIASPLDTMFVHGFRYICLSFYESSGVRLILKAIEAGFLETFVAWSTSFPYFTAKDQGTVVGIFLDSFILQTIYLPVLFATEDAIKRIEAKNTTRGLFQRSTKDAQNKWSTLVEIIKKRARLSEVLLAYQDVVHPLSHFVCENCSESFNISNRKTCAACGYVDYCSKTCQIQSWKEGGHREQCKLLRGDGKVLSYKDTANGSWNSASRKQVDRFICDLARFEALENIDNLRVMARKQLPDVHIEDVGVELEKLEKKASPKRKSTPFHLTRENIAGSGYGGRRKIQFNLTSSLGGGKRTTFAVTQ